MWVAADWGVDSLPSPRPAILLSFALPSCVGGRVDAAISIFFFLIEEEDKKILIIDLNSGY